MIDITASKFSTAIKTFDSKTHDGERFKRNSTYSWLRVSGTALSAPILSLSNWLNACLS